MKKFIIPVLGLMVVASAVNAQTTPAKTKTHKAAATTAKSDSTKTTVHHTAKKTAPKKTSK